ncbi:MAG: PDZ domain-containing protein [candidate division WOR-3 bacterium]|nr:PDZ domain-containing protein [candidate division WOR-3 bacterium]
MRILTIAFLLFPTLTLAQNCAGCPNSKGETEPCHWLEVTGVVPDGPAAKAGIRVGDALASYDGKAMGCRADLSAKQAAVQVDSVIATFRRGNKELSFVLPKGKLGIFFAEWMNDVPPDSDAKLIAGVPNLSWNEMNSFMGALEAIGHKLGDHSGYTFLCGVSGAAFRTQFFDTWCPSSPDATVGYDAGAAALKARGLDATWLHVSSDGKNKPQILAAIRKSIDAGTPVLAIDLIETAEWGVIIGYQKNGEELLCRTYFDKHKLYEVAQKFPFAVAILKREAKVPDEDATVKQGFGIVAENLTTPKYGEYFSGLAAFDKWMARLRDDDFSKLDSAKLSNVIQANYWTFSRLIADRKTGIEYLNIVAQRMPGLEPRTAAVAALYKQELGVLEPLLEQLPCPGSVVPGWQWSKADRDKQIAVLTTARAFEEQALPVWKELAGTK